MAQLLPESFDGSKLVNDGERQIAGLLKRRLGPEWLVIPNFTFRRHGYDHEIDFVLIHAAYGIGILEVKSGRLGIKDGAWVRNANDEDPDEQARRNAYGLRDLLSTVVPTLPPALNWGIALPDARNIVGQLPSDIERHQLLLAPDLEELDEAIHRLFARRAVLLPSQISALINQMCPTTSFTYDAAMIDQLLQNQIDAVCDAQVSAVKELEINHRIYVEGRAGTGKTYLATRWAQSALIDGQRVLLTCYNDPLGQQLRDRFHTESDEDDDGTIAVGPFLPLMLELTGMPPLPFDGADENAYWGVAVPAHIMQHWAKVADRFDCIIVDEAQDFSPAWIGLLESLLDTDGANKFFLLADGRQTLHDRGFTAPSVTAGWVQARLTANVRNPRDIATIARRYLDGASAPASMPLANAIHTRAIMHDDGAVLAVRDAIAHERGRGVAARDIFVVAARAELRNRLRRELGLTVAEARSDEAIGCETAHRAKGLEYPVVIVVAGEQGFNENALYVAITRASNRLWVIGGAELLNDLGLPAES